jgi:hypothetical protein
MPEINDLIMDDSQDAIIVGNCRVKGQGKKGLTRIPSGILEDRHLNLAKYFKMIEGRPERDENLNERIQKEGARTWGGVAESVWYKGHKGYSRNI